MEMLESFKLAAEGLWVNKMRSFLTMLGIIIGVGAVITVMAIGQGGKAVIIGEMERFGANSFTVTPKNSFTRGRSDNRLRMTMKDIKILQHKAADIQYIYPLKMVSGEARYGKVKNNPQVIATTPDFKAARNLEFVAGRFFNTREMQAQRRVAVIDGKLAKELFKKEAPIGQLFKLNGNTWTVIGVVIEDKSTFSFIKNHGLVYLPVTTYQITSGDQYFNFIQGVAVSKDKLEEASQQALAVLNKEHRTVNKFEVQTLDTIVQAVSKIVNTLTLIIGAVAGISLFVGGIGVMNIMLVSVTERTREIGIRKSMGATRRDILKQFLVEALVLCLIGGLMGILLGAGSAFLISSLMKFPPLINIGTVLVAVGFSLAVGLFFGIYPANKAARLDPIEALRYE